MQAPSQHTPILPVLSLIFAATMWGIFWIPLRWLEQQGLHGLTVTILIYSGTLIYIIPVLFRNFGELSKSPGLLIGIIISSGWCNTSFILALLEGEVVRVILLFYLSPVWSTLFARFVLKEKISNLSYMIIALAIVGAMIMLWSPSIGFPWPASYADWLAISSGFTFALVNMFIHMAGTTSIRLKMVMSWLGVLIISGLFLLFNPQEYIAVSGQSVFFAILTGILLIGPMTWAVVFGVTHMPIHRSAVILLFEIVVSVISTYLLIEERLSLLEWVGGGIVIISAYLAARHPPDILKPVN